MADAVTAYIGLGSNLGNRNENIQKALAMLAKGPAVELLAVSDIIESPPLAGMDQGCYLNAAARLRTTLSASRLLHLLQTIENDLGRTRTGKWTPRTIDLDILIYGRHVIDTPELTIPHSRLHLRTFAMAGIAQLAPDFVHPVLKEPISELLRRLRGQNFHIDPSAGRLVCIGGLIGVGKTTLANTLAKRFDTHVIHEAYDSNPFLPGVYAGRQELALDCQLYFLLSRATQLEPTNLEPTRPVFCDYVFQKEMIYAKQLLDKTQLDLYQQIYHRIADQPSRPVLAIYLKDTPQRCMQRIKQRNRPYEQRIEQGFLQSLADAYDRLFDNWTNSPVIELAQQQFDCYNHDHMEHLARQIQSYTHEN